MREGLIRRSAVREGLIRHACAHAQVNSGFFYSSAEQREKLVAAERAVTDERVQRVIDLKNQVLTQRAASPRMP